MATYHDEARAIVKQRQMRNQDDTIAELLSTIRQLEVEPNGRHGDSSRTHLFINLVSGYSFAISAS